MGGVPDEAILLDKSFMTAGNQMRMRPQMLMVGGQVVDVNLSVIGGVPDEEAIPLEQSFMTAGNQMRMRPQMLMVGGQVVDVNLSVIGEVPDEAPRSRLRRSRRTLSMSIAARAGKSKTLARRSLAEPDIEAKHFCAYGQAIWNFEQDFE